MSAKAMTRELLIIIDEETGALTIEGLSGPEARSLTEEMLPRPIPVNCARPLNPPALRLAVAPEDEKETIRLLRIYHGSVCDGPGRRSVIQTQGCSIRCDSCHIPETHSPSAGRVVAIEDAVREALSPDGEPRDGVTITGGEPFDQPQALAQLLRQLKARGTHTLVYTGFTIETLLKREEPEVREALTLADTLIDGPFVVSLARGAMGWRGSTNQRIINQPSALRHRRAGEPPNITNPRQSAPSRSREVTIDQG